MDSLEKLRLCGVVPVVVLDDAKNAIPTAKALLAGGAQDVGSFHDRYNYD